MKNSTKLDVLVVYSGRTAASAHHLSNQDSKPFIDLLGQASYNSAYEYFLEHCKLKGLSAGLSTTTDVIGQGTCNSYWTFENKNWEKVSTNCHSTNILDKFSSKNKALKTAHSLCFSSDQIRPFNSQPLKKLFTDKLLTYKTLPEFTIPTIALKTETDHDISTSINGIKELVSLNVLQLN